MRNRIYGSRGGAVFTPSDFLDLGSRRAVDLALHRLVKRKILRRLARGLYEHPREHPEATKHAVYEKQTAAARAKKRSNCPLCAVGHDANKSRVYELEEMDADHVSAWSKGGDSSAKNCQVLCITHNRAKGNR